MEKIQHNFSLKIHLIISVLIVIPISFIYGFKPDFQFNIYLNTTDEYNVFKATMGLYLGFSTLWVLGIFKTKYFKTALISNVVFMLGLGFGRLLSLLIDGLSSSVFLFGTIGELFIGIYGLFVLKRSYGLNKA